MPTSHSLEMQAVLNSPIRLLHAVHSFEAIMNGLAKRRLSLIVFIAKFSFFLVMNTTTSFFDWDLKFLRIDDLIMSDFILIHLVASTGFPNESFRFGINFIRTHKILRIIYYAFFTWYRLMALTVALNIYKDHPTAIFTAVIALFEFNNLLYPPASIRSWSSNAFVSLVAACLVTYNANFWVFPVAVIVYRHMTPVLVCN